MATGDPHAGQFTLREQVDSISNNGASGTPLNELIVSINDEVTLPLAVLLSGLVYSIGPYTVTNTQTGKKHSAPLIDGLAPSFASGTVTIPSSPTGSIVCSPGNTQAINLTVSNYQHGIYVLESDGNLNVVIGTEGVSTAAATIPTPADGHAIAKFTIFNNAGTVEITETVSFSGATSSGGSLALGETSTTAHRGDHGKIGYDHSLLTSGNPHSVTSADLTLGNVDNTSDATKNGATATLTNKTLTAPIINSPTGIVKGDVGLGNVTDVATDDTAYNATSWNTNLDAPTKNAVRDKFEADKILIDANTAKAPGLTTETITVALPVSGPFVATTMSVTLVRIETAPSESIVTMVTTQINETGNSTSDSILIDASLIPVRFRPTSDQRYVGVGTVQQFSNDTGWFNASNATFWRFWRTSSNGTWNTASTVRVYASNFTWIGT